MGASSEKKVWKIGSVVLAVLIVAGMIGCVIGITRPVSGISKSDGTDCVVAGCKPGREWRIPVVK